MKPIPSLQDLYTAIAEDFRNRLNLSDADLKFVLDALGGVLSAQFKILYLYLKDNQDNIFPDTASLAVDGGTLERLGLIYLNRLPFPPTEGTYTATVTGTPGAILRAGLTFQSTDLSQSPGFLYILDNEYTMPGATGTITLRSLNAGLDYTLSVGDQLQATEPVLGINQTIVIASVVDSPEEGESVEIYRQAILDAIRLEPQGGAKTDYRLWASDAQGVRKVYPYVKNNEPGTVQVYVEATTADSTDQHGTPTGSILTDVAEVIEFDPDITQPLYARGRRPIQANVEVLPINPVPVDIAITGLQTNTAAIRDAIKTNITDYLYDIRPYIAGADLPREKNDQLTAIQMQSIVSSTIGTSNLFLAFKLFVQGVETNSSTFALANIPYLRNIVYN